VGAGCASGVFTLERNESHASKKVVKWDFSVRAGPVTVYVTPFTRFAGGLASLEDLTNNPSNPLRVIGIVLKDPVSGQPVFVARSVTELPN
jgi:hypothetical protein